MSAKYTFWAWGVKVKNAPLKLALLQLADNANDDGVSWYSVPKMADRCDMSERALQGHIKELVSLGLLSVKDRPGTSRIYQLQYQEAQLIAPQILHRTPAEVAPQPPQILHHTPAEVADDPNNEPNKIDPIDGASANAEPPASVEQKSQSKNTPYQSILDAYHKLLPEMPAIRELTESRKTKIRNFWYKFKFNEERWEAYLKYIATNCRWMCEARKRRDGESSWKPKNLEFLITERCYLGVREGRFDDE